MSAFNVGTLAPILAWFTEGLDTTDLQSARTLLDDLEKPRRPRRRRLTASAGCRPISISGRRKASGGNRRQVPACGVVENTPVAGHQYGIRHPRRGDDQPVSRVAMKCVW